MIELSILSGKKAGARVAARRFPFRIGRAAGNDLPLEDDGVWDRHLTLNFIRTEGFVVTVETGAIATVNGENIQARVLRNGDQITMGSACLQFWLAPARQRGLWFREAFVWALIVLATISQLALIYWLTR